MRTTGSTFRAQPADGTESYVSDLGSVADVIAANIYLNPGGFVKLTVNGVEKKVHAPGEIYFINHCYYDSAMTIECKPEPYNMQDKKRRNDFFLNYKAFRRGGAKECELFMVEGYDEENPVDVVCHPEWFIKEGLLMRHPVQALAMAAVAVCHLIHRHNRARTFKPELGTEGVRIYSVAGQRSLSVVICCDEIQSLSLNRRAIALGSKALTMV